jgi:hypothetical protein
MQRMVASKMFVGSIVAIVIVAVIAVGAYLVLTDRLALPFFHENQTSNGIVAEEPDLEPEQKEQEEVPATDTPEPTATPYVFEPSDVTKSVKSAMKPLLARVKPFLAFSASFYADGSHRYKWDDVSATTLALYRLQYVDADVKYGDAFTDIQKKVKKEMRALYDKAYTFDLTYSGTFPDYVYVRSGNTVVYNAVGISGKTYKMEVQKILEYKKEKYRVIVNACLVNQTTKAEGDSQKYTLFVRSNEKSKYGYTIDKIRLYKKEDKKLPL